MKAPATDPALWERRPKFGPAGGPMEVALTQEGRERAFQVGAQVRDLESARALELLADAGGGPKIPREYLADLGAVGAPVWRYLQTLGYIQNTYQEGGLPLGPRLTADGWLAVHHGHHEQNSLLRRCQAAAAAGDGA